MGALFGFLGPRDDGLAARMAEVLAHRGRRLLVEHHPGCTIGVRAHPDRRHPLLLTTGIARDADDVLGFAGHLVGEQPAAGLTPLLSRAAIAEQVHGAFALARFDGRSLTLARDGVGVRTLYWARFDGRVFFASEPKAILAIPGFPRRLRPAALAQYLTFSFVPGEGTMLEGVHELLPGQALQFEGAAAPRSTRFFHFEDDAPAVDAPPVQSDEAWVDTFRRTLFQAIDERLPPAGEPIGVFLSGGIDSSVVTAALSAVRPGQVRTYSIHFGAKYPHELDFARAVATQAGTIHEEFLIEPKGFLPRLRRIIWHLDDPIGDPITVPNFELASHVARGLTTVFNGEGGDPVFGGPKNLPMLLSHFYGGIERGPRFREQAYLASYRRGYEELERLLTPELRAQIEPERDLEAVLTPFLHAEQPPRFLDKLIALNIRVKGAHLILPKVERMTGAAGLTAFSPFFDERMVRLSPALPPHLKLAAGVEKVVMKRAFAGLVPDVVIARPKSGMRVPVHHWFQGEMRRYARHLLDPKRLKRHGIWDPERVKQLLAYDTEEANGRYGIRLWMLLTFETWRAIVIDGEAP
jgi:asparagine synthase (glutamine-hydrolysing)